MKNEQMYRMYSFSPISNFQPGGGIKHVVGCLYGKINFKLSNLKNMNTIASFRKCTLSNNDLLQKIDVLTDEIFEKQQVPKRHIPARPNDDYDLLIGELLQRFNDKWISVDNELPEVGEYVLVYNTEGAILVARCMMNGWAAFFADGEKLMGELAATHWMPLPSAPLKNRE